MDIFAVNLMMSGGYWQHELSSGDHVIMNCKSARAIGAKRGTGFRFRVITWSRLGSGLPVTIPVEGERSGLRSVRRGIIYVSMN